MICKCPDDSYTIVEEGGQTVCKKTTEILNVECPEGCETIVDSEGFATCTCADTVDPIVESVFTDIDIFNEQYFRESSWTMAFSLDIGKWISFYDFKPNFYVNHNNYFQTGYNIADSSSKKGLWTHLLTNKSYQVFNGESYDWEIEVPIENKQVNKYLQSFAYRLDSRKYLTETEYHQNQDIGFDSVFIYNGTNSTGKLKLDLQKTLKQLSQYPILEADSQRILQSRIDEQFRFNYFYNRVPNESLIKALITHDENNINREVNTEAVSFLGKRVLERMRGTSFLVNLRSEDTEHKKIFEISTMSENLYK